MNQYSSIFKAVRDGFPYVIEDEKVRAVLTGFERVDDEDPQAIYTTGHGELKYTLNELRYREDEHLLRTIVRHPSSPCVRARFDPERNAWLLEVNRSAFDYDAKGWQEERCFYCGRWECHPKTMPETFISGYVLECLADYAKRGFLFVDR